MSNQPRIGPYASPLEEHQEYVQAVGMLTIEIACLERMLANLLGAVLNVDMAIAEAIYLTPKSNMVRIEILANVAGAKLRFRPAVLATVNSIIKRSRGVIEKRHNIVHSEYRVHPETGEIMICSLGGKGRKLEPFPVQRINSAINDTRSLIIQSLHAVTAVQAKK